MFTRDRVTLNIESTDIRYMVMRGKGIVDWGSFPLEPGLVKHGSIVEKTRVAAAIRSLFEEKGLSKKKVTVCLPSLRSALRVLTIPMVKPALLEEAIYREAEREFPVTLDELYISYQLIAKREEEQLYLVLGVPKDILDSMVNTLTQAGIKMHAVNLKPLALANAVVQEEAIIVDLESDTFDIAVIVDGIPAVMRTVIARGHELSSGSGIQQLSDELNRTISFYNSGHRDHPITAQVPIYLTGMLADDTDISSMVQQSVENPVEVLSPSSDCPPDLQLARYAANIGLIAGKYIMPATGKSSASTLVTNLNVLPQKYRPQRIPKMDYFYPVMASSLIVALFFVYQIRANNESRIADTHEDLTSINLQIDDTRETVIRTRAALADIEAEADSIRVEREALPVIFASSDIWSCFHHIVYRLPQGVWLTSIDETAKQINLKGCADRIEQVTEYMAALGRTGEFYSVYAPTMAESDSGDVIDFTIIAIPGSR